MKSKFNWDTDSTLSHSDIWSILPFSALQGPEFREVYRTHRPELSGYEYGPVLRGYEGNYVAGYILCTLRKEARANKIRCKDLTTVLALPTEMVIEIFEHLHPIDLYHLIHTSKSLRSLLLSRQSSPVWRQVFRRHPDIPMCPFSIAFPKWVSILFGPATCDKCGHPQAMVDFVFLDHLCGYCVADHRVRDTAFNASAYKAVNEQDLRNLVRKSHLRGISGAMYYPSADDHWRPPIYSLEEISERANEIKALLLTIEANAPNAAEKYEEFKNQTAAVVLESMSHAKICDNWSFNLYLGINCEFEDLVERWTTHLRSLGYDSIDLAAINRDIRYILHELRIRNFSKTEFKRSLPEILKELLPVAGKRLAQERRIREREHRTKVDSFYYEAYKRSSEQVFRYLPNVTRIYEIEVISAWISSERPDEFPAKAANKHIRLYIDKYMAYGRNQVSQVMEGQFPSSCFDGDPLQVAAAVFECPFHTITEEIQAVVGWGNIALHFDCIVPKNSDFLLEDVGPGNSFTYSVAGFNTMRYLLGGLGLDPFTTLATDLTSLNARFLCVESGCPEYPSLGKGRPAMTLQDCVSHAARNLDHTPRSFEALTEEAIKSVIFHEGALPYEGSWICVHCLSAGCVGGLILPSRTVVSSHIQQIHSIVSPVEGSDFFYRPIKNYQSKRYHLRLDPPGNYRCNQCPEQRKLRFWNYEQVAAHLLDKHGIPRRPIADSSDDWIQIAFFKDNEERSFTTPFQAITSWRFGGETDAEESTSVGLEPEDIVQCFKALPGDCYEL